MNEPSRGRGLPRSSPASKLVFPGNRKTQTGGRVNDGSRAFTLVELLVTMGILSFMVVMMVSVTSSAQRIAKQTTSRVEQFREARRAFERINHRLSQATLNTYWDYVNAAGNVRTAANSATFTPSKYARVSELRYLQSGTITLPMPHTSGTWIGQAVFFQAPLSQTGTTTLLSQNSLLNTVGYFVEKGPDTSLRPPTVSGTTTRFRLFELTEPTEALTIYSLTSGSSSYNGNVWFLTPMANPAYSHPLSDNIIALVFQAEYTDPLITGTTQQKCEYNSAPKNASTQAIEENNLPPVVRVTMIAVDDISAQRIQDQNIPIANVQADSSNPTVSQQLQTLEGVLQSHGLNYRRFQSAVTIGSAKWSAK